MQMAVIIDIVLAAVLALFVVLGVRRGAFKSLIGIVVVVAALLGAWYLSGYLAPTVSEKIEPIIADQVSVRVHAAAEKAGIPMGDTQAPEESADSTPSENAIAPEADDEQPQAQNLFSALGLYRSTANQMAKSAADQVRAGSEALVDAAIGDLVSAMASAILFLLLFLALFVLLKLLSKVLGLLTKAPGIHFADAVGGGVFGLIQGALFLFAMIWVMQFLNFGFSQETVSQTVLFRFFATANPLALISAI